MSWDVNLASQTGSVAGEWKWSLPSPSCVPMANGWDERADGLHRRLVFADFGEAWRFMNKVAAIAESQNHHPDWSNSYNTVDIVLCSHDVGRTITGRDHRLARAINELLGENYE